MKDIICQNKNLIIRVKKAENEREQMQKDINNLWKQHKDYRSKSINKHKTLYEEIQEYQQEIINLKSWF